MAKKISERQKLPSFNKASRKRYLRVEVNWSTNKKSLKTKFTIRSY